MKNVFMIFLVVLWSFSVWMLMFIVALFIFLPVIPIMFLAFPMIFLDLNHWSVKPYLWYFKTVWIPTINQSLKLIKQ